MAVAAVVVAFWFGVFVVLFIEAFVLYAWFISKPLSNARRAHEAKPKPPQMIEELARRIRKEGAGKEETCQFLNVGLSFIFQELRDSLAVKRFIMTRVQKEFEEFMTTKTEGKLVEQLTVRDYNLGTQLPIFHSATVTNIAYEDQNCEVLKTIDISLEVEYQGGAQVCIDADLVLGRCAFVSVKVCRLRGRGRLRFTRDSFTHWSFSFYETPDLNVEVECHVDGRVFTQLSNFIEGQIFKWLRKKYTLPNYKSRFLPFFTRPIPQDQRVEVYMHDSKLTVGDLEVEVVDCTRLPVVHAPTEIFCTLELAGKPCQPLPGVWRSLWPVVECIISSPDVGAFFGEANLTLGDEDKQDLVVVRSVLEESAAEKAGLVQGDVVYSANNMKVTTLKSLRKLINKINTDQLILTVLRPPSYVQQQMVYSKSQVKRKHTSIKDLFDGETSPLDVAGMSPPRYRKVKDRKRRSDKGGKAPPPPPLLDCSVESNLSLKRSTNLSDASSFSANDLKQSRLAALKERNRSPSPEVVMSRSCSQDTSWRRLSHEDPLPRSSSVISKNPYKIPAAARESHGGDGSVSASPPSPTADQPTDQPDSATTAATDTQEIMYTSLKHACQNPSWKEKFSFVVSPAHQYLNIRLWYRLEERKEHGVAHLSVSLLDVAMQCLQLSSCTHSQRYIMLPVEPLKFGANRAAIKVTGGRGNALYQGPYGGDIFLRMKHTTKLHQPPPNTGPAEELCTEQGAAGDDCSGSDIPVNMVDV